MPLPFSATHWPVFDIKEKEHLQIIVRLRAVLGHASWRPPQASNVPAAPWILSLKMLRTYLLAWCRNNPTIDEETFQFDHVCWIPVILVALSYKLLHCGAGLALSAGPTEIHPGQDTVSLQPLSLQPFPLLLNTLLAAEKMNQIFFRLPLCAKLVCRAVLIQAGAWTVELPWLNKSNKTGLLLPAFEVCIALAIFAYLALPAKNSQSSARAPCNARAHSRDERWFCSALGSKSLGQLHFKGVWNPALFGTDLFMPFI